MEDVFYFINEDGNLSSETTFADLPEEVQEIYENYNPYTVSSGDIFINSEYNFSLNYDELDSHLYDVIANVPAYDIYPSTASIQVFQDVLLGIDDPVGYVIVSSSAASDVSMYYSDKYIVNGNSITLQSPVTQCRYYTYRPSSTSTTYYRYEVLNYSGDANFTLGTQLAYTNLVEGYPALQRDSIHFDTFPVLFAIALMLGILCFKVFSKGR